MTKPSILVTRPKHDYTTRYISAWAEKTITSLAGKFFAVFELTHEKVTKKNFESMITKHSPELVYVNGHGNSDVVRGHDNEPLVQAGINEEVLKDTITYSLSCQSAQVLGPAAVKSGARTYIGYKEDFIFLFSDDKRTRPLDDKTAELFLEPANQPITSLANGHTVAEACLNTKKAFHRNIKKLLTSESSYDDKQAVRYLLWDMQNLVCHGDGDAKA